MKYPTEIERGNIKYRFIKEYKHFGLYESISGGYKTCFGASDLGLIRSIGVYEANKLVKQDYDLSSLSS